MNTDYIKQNLYRGCLIGGAIGNALGYPVEFLNEKQILSKYGRNGIQTLEQAGTPSLISDDTQMTLFTANAILYSGKYHVPLKDALWCSYCEWLGTQGNTSKMNDPSHPEMYIYNDKRLHSFRSPKITCIDSISTSTLGGEIYKPINNSKDCGSVMRAAPFGLSLHFDPAYILNDDIVGVHKMAVLDAALTHGNIMAWASSSILAQIIFYIVQKHPRHDYPLQDAIMYTDFPAVPQIHDLLKYAVRLSYDNSVSDIEAIHLLGEGWAAEESLAVAVFCSSRYQNDFASAIRTAVNHKGDSGSTGSVCGNILGSWLGYDRIKTTFNIDNLELNDLILKIADSLFEMAEK